MISISRTLVASLAILALVACSDRDSAPDGSTPPDTNYYGWDWRDTNPWPPDLSPDGGPTPDSNLLCGNGKIDGKEKCDRGVLNSLLPDAPCRPDCTLPRCGDTVKDSGEECDDGNTTDGDGCSAKCALDSKSALLAQPVGIHFGAVGLGCGGAKIVKLALHNPTGAVIKITSAALAGCSAEVTSTSPSSSAADVAPGGSVTLSVIFTAAKVGIKSCALKVSASDGKLIVPVTAKVSPKTTQQDSYLQKVNRKVDILFVIDPSGSMMPEKTKLMATAPVFAAAAAQHKLDFHLGSISLAKPYTGPAVLGLLAGDPRFITKSTPDLNDEFKERINLSSASGTEVGFDAIIASLSPARTGTLAPTCSACGPPNICLSGKCRGYNWGFRRPGASLEVLTFTDEDDGSTATVQQALSTLQSQVNPLLGSFARVHGLLPTGSCASGTTTRWTALIKATGGQVNDLCAADYSPAIKALTSRIFGLQDQFFLSRPAVASSIKVTVDGKAETGFTFDKGSNSITFKTAPKDTAAITVDYSVTCN